MSRRPVLHVVGVGALLALGTSSLGYGAYAVLAPVPTASPAVVARSEVTTPAAAVTLPGYGGVAIGAADREEVYAGRDLDGVRPIASITKVITALVVLAEHPIEGDDPGETITLTTADSRLPAQYRAINGTVAPAPAGATLSQRQVIELMMVHSANNYAETLATWAFGSVDSYLLAARAWLDDNDLAGITVADTTGFSPLNTASPRTLLHLARVALDDPVVSVAAALPRVSVPGIGSYDNRNLVLGVDGVTGLKTGTLRVAGACLLFSAQQVIDGEEVEVVGAVLAGPDHPTIADDVRTLLATVRDDFHELTLGEAGELVARYETQWGATATLHLAESVDDIVWGEVRSMSFVRAPQVQPGMPLPDPGSVTVRYGERTVSIPLEWRGALEGPDLAWRLAQPIVEALGE